jgi:hypothetical protein
VELKRRTKPQEKRIVAQGGGQQLTALIDGDIIRYQAASVSDGVSYHHLNDPDVSHRYKKDMVAFCDEQNWATYTTYIDTDGVEKTDHLIIKTITPEPVSYCLHTLKVMIEDIETRSGCTTSRIFLTGVGNYRETLSVSHPYKGQRPPGKPTHFEAAGEYLRSHYGAEVIDGKEADDALGYEHLKSPDTTVICSTDKDLLMIPGQHYSWSAAKDTQQYFDYPYNTTFTVDQDSADRFFFQQLLAGDSVDNIKGIRGVGMKGAAKILLEEKTPLAMYNKCVACYEEAEMTLETLRENADLLWIQRIEDELWLPPNE